MIGWKNFASLSIFKSLRFKKGAVITTENDDNTTTDISISELVALNDLGATDLAKIDGITNGTAAAGKALVLGASKEIATITTATITTVNSTNVDAGASGTAGTVDVFPATAAKGKLAITCADQTGDTTVSLVAGAMTDARTITIRDPGAAASILTTTDATAAATTATAAQLTRVAAGALHATATFDPGSLVDGAGETSAAITVTGAAFGDFVLVGAPYDLVGITVTGYVSAADAVKIRVQNESGGTVDLASGTWAIRVLKLNS